jgi:hypothetical protein
MNKQINVVNFSGNLKPNYLLGAEISTVMYVYIYITFSGSAAQCGLWPPRSRGFLITHNAPQSVGLLWTSDQPVAETSTWQHNPKQTNIHAPSGIRTHNRSKRAVVDIIYIMYIAFFYPEPALEQLHTPHKLRTVLHLYGSQTCQALRSLPNSSRYEERVNWQSCQHNTGRLHCLQKQKWRVVPMAGATVVCFANSDRLLCVWRAAR